MAVREFTNDETINLLREKSAASSDNFRVKLWRYEPLSGAALHFATFSEASVTHITNHELWVPQFCGGGKLAFLVYHASDLNTYLGSYIKFNVEGEPRPLDLSAPFSAGWVGPRGLEFPRRQQSQPYNTVASSLNPAGSSPQTNVPGGGGGAPLFTLQQSNDPGVAKALADLQIKIESFSQSKAALDDEKRRLELDRMRHDNEMRLREMEIKWAQHAAAAAAAQASQPKPAEHNALKDIAAIFAPILQTVLQSQAATRDVMLKLEAERSARESEARVRSEKVMIEMMNRPLIDPALLAILEKSREGTPQAEMVTQMAGAMGNVAEITMNVLGQAAEMAGGGQEHWGLTAAREVSKALGALVGGMRPPGAPGVKPGARPPVPPSLPAQTQAAGFAGLPGAAPSGNGAVAEQNFQPPAPGVAAQSPATAPAPVRQPQSVIEHLIASIKAHAPPHAVAQAVINSLNDPGFSAELDAVNGSMQALAAKYLTDWLPTDPRNMPYVQALFSEIERQGKAAGVFEDEKSDGEQAETDQSEESDQDSA